MKDSGTVRAFCALFVAAAVLCFAAAPVAADEIDFNFTGGTLAGVDPLASDLDNDWIAANDGPGPTWIDTALPTGGIDADDFGDYIATSLNAVSFTVDGLTVTASGHDTAGSTRLYGDTKGTKGGLGVYDGDGKGGSVGGAGSNDNIQAGESVRLVFDTRVGLSGGYFFDSGHGKLSKGEEFKVVVDAGTADEATYYFTASGASAYQELLITGSTFEFFNLVGVSGRTGADFYVSMVSASVVPEPSTIVLMGAAGLGVIFMGRRRRRLAAVDETAA